MELVEMTKVVDSKLDITSYFTIMSQEISIFNEIKPNIPTTLNVPETNMFRELNGLTVTISEEVLDSYYDVYQIDFRFFKNILENPNQNINDIFRCVCFFTEGSYDGCIWIKVLPDYIGLYGIRTSLQNFILNKRGKSLKMLELIKQHYSDGHRRLVAINPLRVFTDILKKQNYQQIIDKRFFNNFILTNFGIAGSYMYMIEPITGGKRKVKRNTKRRVIKRKNSSKYINKKTT
jgi:hypothetical protein